MQAMAQACNVSLREPHRQVGGLVVVTAAEDLAAPVYPCQCLAVGQRDVQPENLRRSFEPAIDRLEQLMTTFDCRSGPHNAWRIAPLAGFQAVARRGLDEVDLVHRPSQPLP